MSALADSGYVFPSPREGELWVQQVVYVPASVMTLAPPAKRQWAIQAVPPSQRAIVEQVASNAPGPKVGHLWLHIGFGASRISGYQPGQESCVDVLISDLYQYWKRL